MDHFSVNQKEAISVFHDKYVDSSSLGMSLQLLFVLVNKYHVDTVTSLLLVIMLVFFFKFPYNNPK